MSDKRKYNYKPSFSGNQYNKNRNRFALEAGTKGFLCTCNFREKDCVREAYNLLNEFSEKLESPDVQQETVKKFKENESDEDISTALEKELNELKEETKKPVKQRKFQVVETGAKNVIFIQSTVEDPLKLVTAIIEDIEETKRQRARFILRLIPIQCICKAYMDDIKTKASEIFDKFFVLSPKTFAIVFNRHSNSNIQRSQIIEELAKIISDKNADNKVNLENPEIAVVIEVIRNMCLISIAPKYFAYKKYNLLELGNPNPKTNEKDEESKTEEEDKQSTKEKEVEEKKEIVQEESKTYDLVAKEEPVLQNEEEKNDLEVKDESNIEIETKT